MKETKKTAKIKFYIFASLIFVAIIFLIFNWREVRHLNMHKVLMFIQRSRGYSWVIYLVLFALKPLLIVIPATIMSLAAGVLFGPVWGCILALTGFFLSGTVAFLLSRFLGREFVESLVGDKLKGLEQRIEKSGFKIIFLLRLPPVIPYDPLSYACGLSNIDYYKFILGSVLAVIPETLCYTVIGGHFNNLKWWIIIPIVILVVATILGGKMLMKKD